MLGFVGFVSGQKNEVELENEGGMCFVNKDMDCLVVKYDQLIALKKERYGTASNKYYETVATLALMLLSEKETERAMPYVDLALETIIAALGSDHEDAKQLQTVFIMQLQEIGATEQVKQLEEAIKTSSPKLGLPIAELTDLEDLNSRKEYCMLRQDWACMRTCQERIVSILEDEKGKQAAEYLEALQLLINFQFQTEQWEEAIPNLEYFLKKDTPISKDDKEHLQELYATALIITGRKAEPMSIAPPPPGAIVSKLPENPTIEQLLDEIDRLDKEVVPEFGQQYGQVYEYVLPLEKRFLTRVEKELDGKHERYLEVLAMHATHFLIVAQTTTEPTKQKDFYQQAIYGYKKTLLIIEKEYGKASAEYIEILNNLFACYLFTEQPKQQVKVAKEIVDIYKQLGPEEEDSYQAALRQFLMLSIYWEEGEEEEGELRELYSSYKAEEDEEMIIPVETMIFARENIKAQETVDSILMPIPYPNLLDTFAMAPKTYTFKKVVAYIRKIQDRIDPSLLSTGSDATNIQLLTQFQQELEAFTGFTLSMNNQYPILNDLLLEFNIRYSQLAYIHKDRIRHRHVLKDSPKYKELFQQWIAQKEKLNHYFSLSSAQRKAENFEYVWEQHQLRQLENKLAKAVDESYQAPSLPDWRSLQKQLNKGEALVKIMRYLPRERGNWTRKTDYTALILRPKDKHPIVVQLPDGQALDLEHFQAYQNSRYYSDEGQAYQTYWAPIQAHLENIERVFVDPMGIYQRINLNTLKIPGTKDRYLIDEIDLRLINNLLTFTNKEQSHIRPQTALLMGDPQFNLEAAEEIQDNSNDGAYFRSPLDAELSSGIIWQRLPYSAVEVEKIEALLKSGGVKVKTFTQEKARENRIKAAESPHILHLATHAYFTSAIKRSPFMDALPFAEPNDGEYPGQASWLLEKEMSFTNYDSIRWDSAMMVKVRKFATEVWEEPEFMNPELNAAIVLAGANNITEQEDGVLTAYEISTLNLQQTELVVLSACKSGVSDLINGKGVVGLRGAFELAGANYIINSLWEVRDDLTQEFMLLFYKNWLEQKQDIHTAFRNTHIQLRRQLRNNNGENVKIYEWGGFVLVDL